MTDEQWDELCIQVRRLPLAKDDLVVFRVADPWPPDEIDELWQFIVHYWRRRQLPGTPILLTHNMTAEQFIAERVRATARPIISWALTRLLAGAFALGAGMTTLLFLLQKKL